MFLGSKKPCPLTYVATPTSYPLRKSDADLMAHAMNTKFYKEKKKRFALERIDQQQLYV
jgi:hypothetical protein